MEFSRGLTTAASVANERARLSQLLAQQRKKIDANWEERQALEEEHKDAQKHGDHVISLEVKGFIHPGEEFETVMERVRVACWSTGRALDAKKKEGEEVNVTISVLV
jgi:hypothetical protein